MADLDNVSSDMLRVKNDVHGLQEGIAAILSLLSGTAPASTARACNGSNHRDDHDEANAGPGQFAADAWSQSGATPPPDTNSPRTPTSIDSSKMQGAGGSQRKSADVFGKRSPQHQHAVIVGVAAAVASKA